MFTIGILSWEFGVLEIVNWDCGELELAIVHCIIRLLCIIFTGVLVVRSRDINTNLFE